MQVILIHSKDDPVRLSYTDIFERGRPPKDKPNDPGRYATHAIIRPDGANARKVKEAMAAEAAKIFGPNWQAIVAEISKDKKCLRNGDSNRDDKGNTRDGYAGMMYVKSSNSEQPEVVGKQKGVIFTGPRKTTNHIGHPHAPYSGCYGNVIVDVYASKKHGDAINASLLAVQFADVGQSFGGGSTAGSSDAFSYDEAPAGAGDAFGGTDAFGDPVASTPAAAVDPFGAAPAAARDPWA